MELKGVELIKQLNFYGAVRNSMRVDAVQAQKQEFISEVRQQTAEVLVKTPGLGDKVDIKA